MLRSSFGKQIECARRKVFPCFFIFALTALSALPAWAADAYKDEQTLRDAAHVLDEMFKSNSIPQDLFSKAECVIVMPNVKKGGFGVGGTGGRGPMSCRKGPNFRGPWSAPAMYSIGGVSLGFQVGVTSSDIVLLIMDEKGRQAIMKGKTKLGTDATAAAGPGATSKSAAGNDILTYARSKGLFAGVSLGGASVEADTDANKRIYGQDVAAQDILHANAVKPTDAGQPLVSLLNTKVGR
jgi:lipid-binding SYLF domain-containing protein